MSKPAPHTVVDTVSGISIEERETQGRIAIVINGLPQIEPAQCSLLEHLLAIWKYGLTPKKPRKTKNKKNV